MLLIRLPDSVKTATTTDKDGGFRFAPVKAGQYSVQVNFIGHKRLAKAVQVQNGPVQLGQLLLEEASTTMKEVEVVGQIPLGTQKGDTTVFNAAAFKVADDASAEDLVTKLPGVTVVDGKIQTQGEEVRQVLVDGKRFFGEDANTALRNLPAEVIENIEIFDKKSDQAEFSGFDDGNRAKTINVVTKKNRRKGQFGKVSVGVGPDEKQLIGSDSKYMAGASVNIFNGDRRFTVTGISNNINMQDFSVGEAPGGGMRGRRGGGGGGNGGGTNGISNTKNFGLNYNDIWGKKIEVNGNYNYSNVFNENDRSQFRDYFRSKWNNQQTSSNSFNNSRNESHQFNFRLEYNINEKNRLLISPRLSVQNGRSFSNTEGWSIYDGNPDDEIYEVVELNRTNIDRNTSDSYNYNFSNNINFSHRFAKPGRTFSAGLNTSTSVSDASTLRVTNIENFIEPDKNVDLNQLIKTDRDNFSWRGNVALAERVGEKARLQAEYSISNRFDNSDRLAYDWTGTGANEEQVYDNLNVRLSNSSESEYLTQQAKTSYQYNSEKLRFQLETQYQMANLQNQREYPSGYQTDQTFHNVLPFAQLEYKFSRTKNLQFDFRTSTDAPSINQLQEVVDNTSPLRFSTGNADLVQAYQNSVNLRYRSFNTETNRVVTFFVTANKTDNYITNSTTEENLEQEPLLAGMEILPGARLIKPVNLNGNWSARSFFSYGQPLGFIKSNVNLTGSVGYNRTPGLFNNAQFFTNTTNYRLGASLSSNISQNVDFSLSTSSSYNVVTSTRQETQNNNFFNQSTQLRASLRFWKGLVYRTELSHQLNSGLSSGFNTNYTLLNMSMSKKVLKNQRGEVSFSVNDLLKQNVSIQRTISDSYVQDTRSEVLQRFFMLTFSYNIRNFPGGAPGGRGSGERGSGERGSGERGNYRQGGYERQGGFGGQGGGGRYRDQ